MTDQQYPYTTHLDVRFPPLEVIDVAGLAGSCTDRWFNQTLCRVNDSVMRLGIVQGQYHWHRHERDDEFFFVLDGRLMVELEDRSVELGAWQGFVIPRGVLHRTVAADRTVMLMAETFSIVPTGDG